MKALSIHPFYAMAIAKGEKTVEVRSWNTKYRGPLVICSTNKRVKGMVPGCALCTVELIDVVPLKPEHLEDAMMDVFDFRNGLYAWILDDNRLIKPIPVKGKLSLWEFGKESEIEYIPDSEWVAAPEYENTNIDWAEKYWGPYMIR